MIEIDGIVFNDLNVERFSFPKIWGHQIHKMSELKKLDQFKKIRSINFSSTNINDEGLYYLSQLNCIRQVDYLDLQETQITNKGLKFLEPFKSLNWLRLKENYQLDNECISSILKLENLENLQIHETSINQEGLKNLVSMENLKDIIISIRKDNYTFDGLLSISQQMPETIILAKGRGEFLNGEFEGEWS